MERCGTARLHFDRAYERLTLQFALVARQPGAAGEPSLYNVTINTPEKRLGVAIVVTRPKPEAAAARLHVGARVAVRLMAFRVLPNFALASERGGKIIDA